MTSLGGRTVRRRASVIGLLAAAAVTLPAAAAQADTGYNLYAVASAYTAAQTGAFTFLQAPSGQTLTPVGYQPAATAFSDGPQDHGFHGTDGTFPYFYSNTSGSPYVSGTVTVPAGTFVEHPGGSDAAVTEFTVPGGGAATVSASVTLSNDDTATGSGNSVNGYLFAAAADGSIIGATPTPTLRPRAGSVTLTLPSTAVPAGGHVFLVIDNNGDYSFDSTGVALDVTVAGGPASSLPESPLAVGLPLAGLAAGAVAWVRRRRAAR